jgi:hypothetical protein
LTNRQHYARIKADTNIKIKTVNTNKKISSKQVVFLMLGQNIYFKRRKSTLNLGYLIKHLLLSYKSYAKDR